LGGCSSGAILSFLLGVLEDKSEGGKRNCVKQPREIVESFKKRLRKFLNKRKKRHDRKRLEKNKRREKPGTRAELIL